ncbi:hypothetical protein [Cellulomonas sp. P24]|uniref:hypothetical protein n=1 Tax=Cellulomonas sp. P24 TaxID=2885206 RepID=UPI00216B0184|nr:hypothetical protein [Cellulomonas sp. P24]MCR6494511.1 hypothetical protein [Cellulomonas sp. P24]
MLHLILALPLSVIGALLALGFASFQWCGLTECRWGDRVSPIAVGVLALVAGLVVASPFWLVRWTHRAPVRVAVGLILTAVVAIFGYLVVTHP